jgi:curved DNA-binding protein CbpA
MPELPNYYDILGVRPTDDASTIKRAYYNRMRRFHPDNFIAEYKRLEIVGDKQRLKRLDETIASAQKQTQLINAAYTVLSDPDRRAQYDSLRASRQRQQVQPSYSGSPDDYYDSHRHRRPHTRPTQPGKPAHPERFPALLAVGFLIILTIATAIVSNFLVGSARPRRPTPPAIQIPAGSSDATAIAARRTPTPRTALSYIASGDILYNAGLYDNAVEEYTHALERGLATADVYVKRGRAYAADNAFDAALADFNRAETLDADLPDLYCQRGLVYFRLWQQNSRDADADAARLDLNACAERGGDMTLPAVVEARSSLPDD